MFLTYRQTDRQLFHNHFLFVGMITNNFSILFFLSFILLFKAKERTGLVKSNNNNNINNNNNNINHNNNLINTGKQKAKKGKKQENSQFVVQSPDSNSTINHWCPDITLCNRGNESYNKYLCATKWLFIFTSVVQDSSLKYNSSVSIFLDAFYSKSSNFALVHSHPVYFSSPELLSNLMNFVSKFKNHHHKRNIGAFAQNPFDIRSVYLDLQQLFIYTLLSHPQALVPNHYSNKLQNDPSRIFPDFREPLFSLYINNFLSEHNLAFLRAVFPCSRVVVFHEHENKSLEAVQLDPTMAASVRKYFPESSYLVDSIVDGMEKVSKEFVQDDVSQMIQWLNSSGSF